MKRVSTYKHEQQFRKNLKHYKTVSIGYGAVYRKDTGRCRETILYCVCTNSTANLHTG